eukprot:357584-Chlamydomonas_euryale.AAC.5
MAVTPAPGAASEAPAAVPRVCGGGSCGRRRSVRQWDAPEGSAGGRGRWRGSACQVASTHAT